MLTQGFGLAWQKLLHSGGGHRGVIENVVRDMFDNTILYLVKTCGVVIPAREEALESYKSKKRK